MNILDGKGRAVRSAKLLGKDHEVNMWEPESRAGIMVAVELSPELRIRYIIEDSDTTAENLGAESPEVRHPAKTQ
jgi:hypothetical protein